jgi:hypothetical protein
MIYLCVCMYVHKQNKTLFLGCYDELPYLQQYLQYDCDEEWDMTGGFGHGHGVWDIESQVFFGF